jgi:hypothetical protein
MGSNLRKMELGSKEILGHVPIIEQALWFGQTDRDGYGRNLGF